MWSMKSFCMNGPGQREVHFFFKCTFTCIYVFAWCLCFEHNAATLTKATALIHSFTVSYFSHGHVTPHIGGDPKSLRPLYHSSEWFCFVFCSLALVSYFQTHWPRALHDGRVLCDFVAEFRRFEVGDLTPGTAHGVCIPAAKWQMSYGTPIAAKLPLSKIPTARPDC